MHFLKNIEEIRARARQQIASGAVTKDYKLDREQAISVLNEALATELVCVLRYKFHYFMGFDHGVGHPLLLLYDTKTPLGQKIKEFNGLGDNPLNASVSLF